MAGVAVAAAAAMVVALPVVLVSQPLKAVTGEAEETTTASTSVRVEHEFVTLDAEAPNAEAPVAPAGPVARPLRQPRPALTYTAPASTFTKARQKFLGDGRHRPEPFPRVR